MSRFDFSWHAADGVRLYGRGWEPEELPKRVICLVHGIGEHGGRYEHVAEYFCDRDSAVLAMDMRGHGRSAGPRGHTPSFEALLDDLSAFLGVARERYPDVPRFLYGQSLGGLVVITFALRRQPALAGIIATAPGLELANPPPKWQERFARLMSVIWPTFTASRGRDFDAICRDRSVIDTLMGDPLFHNVITARMLVEMVDTGMWALEHAAELRLPTILLHGGADRSTSVEASRAFNEAAGENCELHIWEDCYHELQNEPEKREVLSIIQRWLEAQSARTNGTANVSADVAANNVI